MSKQIDFDPFDKAYLDTITEDIIAAMSKRHNLSFVSFTRGPGRNYEFSTNERTFRYPGEDVEAALAQKYTDETADSKPAKKGKK